MICVSIANITFSELNKIISEFAMIELRLDLLNFSNEEYKQILSVGIPVIATFRTDALDDDYKINKLKTLIDLGVKYIDIELDASKYLVGKIISYAQSKKSKIILSYHNFNKTPYQTELEKIIEEGKNLGVDYIKIVTLANNNTDVERVLDLYKKHKNLIAFCMGEIGKKSRIESVNLGAKFTYAALSEKKQTANGQYTYTEMQKILKA